MRGRNTELQSSALVLLPCIKYIEGEDHHLFGKEAADMKNIIEISKLKIYEAQILEKYAIVFPMFTCDAYFMYCA